MDFNFERFLSFVQSESEGPPPPVEDDSWINDDPNILNNPELLYKAVESLPPPSLDEDQSNESYNEISNIVREMMLDHNIILEELSQRDEIQSTKGTPIEMMENLADVMEVTRKKCEEALIKVEEQPCWEEEEETEIFSDESINAISEWKGALNEFLESYSKIRPFIPEEALQEEEDNAEDIQNEKEQWKALPGFVDELEDLVNTLTITETDFEIEDHFDSDYHQVLSEDVAEEQFHGTEASEDFH